MVQYRKSALVAISFILLFCVSLFLYSCGQNNPTGAGGNKQTVSNPSAVVAAGTYTQKAYISGMQVPVINLQTNTVLSTLTKILLGGEFAAGIATNNVTGKVYITGVLTSLVLVLNANTDTLANLPVTVGIKPTGIAVNPATNMIYVANSGSNNVSVISGANNAVVATVAVGANPQRIAVDDRKNIIFVTNSMGNSISVIDGVTNTVSATIAITNPADVGVDSLIGQVYVSDRTNNRIAVLDSASNGIKTYINMPTGMIPGRIAVNHVTNQIYVSSIQQGVPISPIVVIDGVSNKIAGLIMPTTGIGSIAISESLNYLYTNQLNYAGDFTTRTIQGTSIITAINLGSIPPLTPPSASPPPAPVTIKPVATITASWSGTMGFNVYIADGDIAILDNAPAGTPQVITPPPPPNASSPAQLVSIRVWTASSSVAAGELSQFNVQGINADGSIDPAVTSTMVVWSLSNNMIAGVDTKGLVTTKSQGNETVTATYQGLAGSAPLSIRKPELSKIDITPLDTSIKQYNIIQYSASGTFTDKTVKDITNEVRWNSNDITIAQVSNMYPFLNLIPNGFLYQNAIGAFAIIGAEGSSTSIIAASTTATGKLIQASATVTVSGGHYRQNITTAQENILTTAYQADPNNWLSASGVVKIRSAIWWESDPYGNNWDDAGNDLGPRYVDPGAASPILPQILVQTGTHNPNLYWYGCHTVSAAMVATKATKQRIDPRLMNNYLHGNNGYTYPNNGPDWKKIKVYAGSAIIAYTNEIPIEDPVQGISKIGSFSAIDNALQNNKMIVIKVHGPGNSFSSHYVVVAGGSNGNYTIYDTWIRTGEQQEQITNMSDHYYFAADATYNVITIQ